MDLIAETPRLILRRFNRDDLDPAAELLSNPQVMQFSLGLKTRDEASRWLERCLSTYAERGWGLWAVVHRQDQRLIGYCGLIPQVVDGREEIEIAYRLLPDYWGSGLGTEAARAARLHAWRNLGLDRLISIIEPANAASIRVAEKQGMRLDSETVAWGKQVRIYAVCRADATS